MFSRVLVAALVAFPMLASAVPTNGGDSPCNVGQLKCCNQLQQSGGNPSSANGGLLGIPIGLIASLGLGCSPLSIIGLNSNQCTAQPACCQNAVFNGINVLNCSPVNVGL